MLIFPGLLANVLFFFCGGLTKIWITLGFLAGSCNFSKKLCQNLMFPGICRWETEFFLVYFPEFDFSLQVLPRSTFHLNFVPGSCFLKVLRQNLLIPGIFLMNSIFVGLFAKTWTLIFVGVMTKILSSFAFLCKNLSFPQISC